MALKKTLKDIGINPAGYLRHSFHTGGATAAAGTGLQESQIKAFGRWRSSVFQLNLRFILKHLQIKATLEIEKQQGIETKNLNRKNANFHNRFHHSCCSTLHQQLQHNLLEIPSN